MLDTIFDDTNIKNIVYEIASPLAEKAVEPPTDEEDEAESTLKKKKDEEPKPLTVMYFQIF